MIKKADIILTVALIIVGLAISYFLTIGGNDGDTLEITVDGEIFGTYSLLQDREISIKENGHCNVVSVSDGAVTMKSSDCANQDCVHQHSISTSGETIVCLPNRIMLEITGGEKQYDSISR